MLATVSIHWSLVLIGSIIAIKLSFAWIKEFVVVVKDFFIDDWSDFKDKHGKKIIANIIFTNICNI